MLKKILIAAGIFLAAILIPQTAHSVPAPVFMHPLGKYMVYYEEASEENNNENRLYFRGSFAAGAGQALVSMLTSIKADVLYLHSPGGIIFDEAPDGSMRGAMLVARFIKNNPQITVRVSAGNYCMSACAVVASAAERLDISGVLAYHKPWFDWVRSTQSINDIVKRDRYVILMIAEIFANDPDKFRMFLDFMENSDQDNYLIITNSRDIRKEKYTYMTFKEVEALLKYSALPLEYNGELPEEEKKYPTFSELWRLCKEKELEVCK